jgi:hypothetical protein
MLPVLENVLSAFGRLTGTDDDQSRIGGEVKQPVASTEV